MANSGSFPVFVLHKQDTFGAYDLSWCLSCTHICAACCSDSKMLLKV